MDGVIAHVTIVPVSTVFFWDYLAMTEEDSSVDVFVNHPYQSCTASRNIGIVHTLSLKTANKILYDPKVEDPRLLF